MGEGVNPAIEHRQTASGAPSGSSAFGVGDDPGHAGYVRKGDLLPASEARVRTEKADRYSNRLCKHFGYKIHAEWTPPEGLTEFPDPGTLRKPEVDPAAFAEPVDQASLMQELQMPAEPRLALPQNLHQVLDVEVAMPKQNENSQACRLGRRLQGSDELIAPEECRNLIASVHDAE